ncbi:MAG: hypothetical protein QW134_09490 [Nitrososphaeria archaeon]
MDDTFYQKNYKDIVERDVVQRYNIRYKNALKDLARYYISNAGQEISFNKLKNILKKCSYSKRLHHLPFKRVFDFLTRKIFTKT